MAVPIISPRPHATTRFRITLTFEGEDKPRDLVIYAKSEAGALMRASAFAKTIDKAVHSIVAVAAGHITATGQLVIPDSELTPVIERWFEAADQKKRDEKKRQDEKL